MTLASKTTTTSTTEMSHGYPSNIPFEYSLVLGSNQ